MANATPPRIYHSKNIYTIAPWQFQHKLHYFKNFKIFKNLLLSNNNFFVKENDFFEISRQYSNFQNEIFKVNLIIQPDMCQYST